MASMRDRIYPPKLRDKEAELVQARRAKAVEAEPTGAAQIGVPWYRGLALSGGGIRSATFCLGVVQSLARRRKLSRFDFLSTVSGGGFFGGFLGALILRSRELQGPRGEPSVTALEYAQRELSDDRSSVLRWLRENGRYLTPNGAADSWFAAAATIRNWLALHLVVGGTLLALMLVAQLARTASARWIPRWELMESQQIGGLWLSPWMPLVALVACLWLIPSAWAYWLTQRPRRTIAPFVGSLLLVGMGLWLSPLYQATGLPEQSPPVAVVFPWLFALLAITSACAFVFWAGATLRGCRQLNPDIEKGRQWLAPTGMVLVLAALPLAAWGILRRLASSEPFVPPQFWLALVLAATSGTLVWAASGGNTDRDRRQLIRQHLSTWTSSALIVTVTLLALGLIDSLAQSIYVWSGLHPSREGSWLAAAVTAVLSGATLFAPWAGRLASRVKVAPRLAMRAATTAAAAGLGLGYLFLFALLSYQVRWGGALPWIGTRPSTAMTMADFVRSVQDRWPTVTPMDDYFRLWFLAWVIGLVLLAVLMRRLFGFVNLSSYHDFYASRLTRAYLGASNQKRYRQDGIEPVTRPIPHDDIQQIDYRPDGEGGPLHLINATVNETVSGRSQVEQRDRKGVPIAIGPVGASVGTSHHAVWLTADPPQLQPIALPKGSFAVWQEEQNQEGVTIRPIEPEALTIGYWLAISGAAFSTSLGFRTSTATSLLAGLFNVRMGYWWDSGVRPAWRRSEVVTPRSFAARVAGSLARLFPVQVALLDEFFGRFHGPARQRWQLSDGGHFENTACYELIRRRLPLIVSCDCGRDPACYHEDLANLVRKVRTDFGSEVAFLTRDQITEAFPGQQHLLGSIEDLVPRMEEGGRSLRSQAHAAVAVIWHEGGAPQDISILLLLKPGMTGDEPIDVREYQTSHAQFPHESTADQFFDEAQWESYRRLGQHVGDQVLGAFLEIDILATIARLRVVSRDSRAASVIPDGADPIATGPAEPPRPR